MMTMSVVRWLRAQIAFAQMRRDIMTQRRAAIRYRQAGLDGVANDITSAADRAAEQLPENQPPLDEAATSEPKHSLWRRLFGWMSNTYPPEYYDSHERMMAQRAIEEATNYWRLRRPPC